MTNYTIIVTRDDTGEELVNVSDAVAEGEQDIYEVVVEDPSLTGSASQTSGN